MKIRDNDHRNNILIDLNRIGFWEDGQGVKYYGYIDQTHPDFDRGIKRMPIQVTVLDYKAIMHLIKIRFKDYFERIHFEPQWSPREMYFHGVKRIKRSYYQFNERINFDEINRFWQDLGASEMDKYFGWMERKFKDWESDPSRINQ